MSEKGKTKAIRLFGWQIKWTWSPFRVSARKESDKAPGVCETKRIKLTILGKGVTITKRTERIPKNLD